MSSGYSANQINSGQWSSDTTSHHGNRCDNKSWRVVFVFMEEIRSDQSEKEEEHHSHILTERLKDWFDSAFRSQRLQNWCGTKTSKERPTAKHGHTTFIANDRGHLLPMVKRGSTWPDFQGTWDLPARIPARQVNPTGRSMEGLNRLKSWGLDPRHTGESPPHSDDKKSARLQFQISGDAQQDCAAPSSAAEARPAPQNPGSIAQSAEDSRAAAGEGTTSGPQPVTGRGSGAPSSSK